MLPKLCARCGMLASTPLQHTTPRFPRHTRALSSQLPSFPRHSRTLSSQLPRFPRHSRTLSSQLPRPESKKDWNLHPMFSIPVVCFGLGIWQINRRKAKLQLIKDIQSRQNMEPINFKIDDKYEEYTPVRVTGTYDYSYQFFLGPRHDVISHSEKGQPGGYHSIVPLVLETGERILVDRGWQSKRTAKPIGQVPGPVTLVGYIRAPEEAVMPILAPPAGSSSTFIWRESGVMGSVSGCVPVTVELLQQCTVEGGPLAGQTRLTLYNKHVEYIVTWFGLGLVSLCFILNLSRRRLPKHTNKTFKI